MSFKKIPDPQEVIMSHLNSQVSILKEEICVAFEGHKKALASRQMWLFDHVDLVKNQAMSLVTKQNISMAEVKTRLEECKEFIKLSNDSENIEGITCASDTMAQLQKKLQQCGQSANISMPVMKFVHDQSQLQDAILSYGIVNMKSCIDDDETDSFTSEKSWDVVYEKNSEDNYEIRSNGDKEISEFENRCCGDSTGCCQQSYEIEDIDLSRILDAKRYLQDRETPGFDSSTLLKGFCKANELCKSISDCVCDTPCLKLKLTKSNDPVLEHQNKMMTLYANQDEQFEDFSGVSPLSDPVAIADEKISRTLSLDLHAEESSTQSDNCDPLAQISSAVQSILGTPEKSDMTTKEKLQSNTEKDVDVVTDIHKKLQSILDGEGSVFNKGVLRNKLDESTFSKHLHVDYRTLPWQMTKRELNQYEKPENSDEVVKLHKRLMNIFQGDEEKTLRNGMVENQCPEYDPVSQLSCQLKQILTC